MFIVSACNPAEDAGSQNADTTAASADPLACAAAISAYSYLIQEGFAASDPGMSGDPLISTMTYLNMYAVPNGLSEPKAFADLAARRDDLRDSASTGEIIAQARECVRNTPAL